MIYNKYDAHINAYDKGVGDHFSHRALYREAHDGHNSVVRYHST